MKKNIIITSSMLMMTAALMTACANKTTETTAVVSEVATEVAETTVEESVEETKEVASDSLKAGLGITLKADKTKDAQAEENGMAQLDALAAAVLFDKDGKILDINIDITQTKVEVSNEGKILTDLATLPKTKKELGDEYGMKKVSSISKEWYEQIEAFENYVIGKTVDEVAGIALDEKTVPTEADLTSSVTMKVGGYIEAIKKAEEVAVAVDANETDKVGVAISSNISKSKDFDNGDAGVVNISNYYAMTLIDSEGKVSGAVLDGSRVDLSFDDLGAFEIDDTYVTKQELGEEYGMKQASSISKEWNEQADAIANYVVGKDASLVEIIELTEDGKAVDADLLSGATLPVEPFKAVLTKAIANAK